MSTFYTGRKRRALDGLRKTQSDQLAEIELGLNGLQRALAIEAGHDLHRIKLESFGKVQIQSYLEDALISEKEQPKW